MTAEPPVHFDAVLVPHRSLPRRGFVVVMTGFTAMSMTVGGIFLAQGAWPVFGLCGLEVLLLWGAFRLNYRAAQIYETVRLTDTALVVQRAGLKGPVRCWTFQPYWLRVIMDDPPGPDSQLELRSHGRSVVIGTFLSPDERADLAVALRQALARHRATG